MVILDPDNNENNQNNQTSEQKLSDRVYAKGVKPELSPNPKFSGFTKQVICELDDGYFSIEDFVDLSDTTYYDAEKGDWLRIEPNTLFVLEYPNGDKEYWTVVDPNLSTSDDEDFVPTTPEENLIRVYPEYPSVDAREPGKTPTPALVKGSNTPNLKENQAPRKRPRVFSEPVAFQEEVFVKGREIGNYNHNIYIGDVVIHLVSSKSTPYSYKEFAEMLYKNGFISSSTALLGSGLSVSSATNTLLITERCGAFSEDGTTIRTSFLRSTASLTSSNRQIRTGDNQMVNVVTNVLFSIMPESQQSETPAISSFKDLVL